MLETFLNVNEPELFYFNYGYLLGTIIVFTIIVLVKTFFFFSRRKKKASGVTVIGNNGTLTISSNAISDLIHSLERKFPALKITKVYLYENKGLYFSVEINVSFQMENEGLLGIVNNLQETVLEKLKTVFGVESITTVNIKTIKASLT